MSHEADRKAGEEEAGSPATADVQPASASAGGGPRRSSPLSTGSFIVAILVLAVLGGLSLALLATWWEGVWR